MKECNSVCTSHRYKRLFAGLTNPLLRAHLVEGMAVTSFILIRLREAIRKRFTFVYQHRLNLDRSLLLYMHHKPLLVLRKLTVHDLLIHPARGTVDYHVQVALLLIIRHLQEALRNDEYITRLIIRPARAWYFLIILSIVPNHCY